MPFQADVNYSARVSALTQTVDGIVPAEFAYNDDKGELYLIRDAVLYIYDLESMELTQSFDFATQPISMDISPDGRYLYVGDAETASITNVGNGYEETELAVYRLDLTSYEVETILVDAGNGYRGVRDVAAAADGTVFVTPGHQYSGGGVTYYFDSETLENGEFEPVDYIAYGSRLTASESGRYVLFQDIYSTAWLGLYDTEAGTIVAEVDGHVPGVGGMSYNKGLLDISEEAGLIVNSTYNALYVFNFSLELVANLNSIIVTQDIDGVAFSPSGDKLYLTDDGQRVIQVVDTDSWSIIDSIPLMDPTTATIIPNGYDSGTYAMTMSDDGRFLFVEQRSAWDIHILDMNFYSSKNHEGTAGNDTFVARIGFDYFEGGDGLDTVDYGQAVAGLQLSLASTSTNTSYAMGDTFSGIEGVIGSAFEDRMTGNAEANILRGEGGRDTLHGGEGDDTLRGDEENDWLYGDNGNDVLIGGEGDDHFFLGDGNDLAWAGKGDQGNDIANGGAGRDTIGGGMGDDTLNGDSGSDILFGGDGDDVLRGRAKDDAAESEANQLWAGAGDDTLEAGNGGDQMGGGAGNDILIGGNGADVMYGGKGYDTENLNADWFAGGLGYDTIYASDGDDTVNAGSGNDVAFGGNGNDIIDAGGGNDQVFGGSGDDTITGNLGDDTLWGGLGADKLQGGAGNDLITGGAGDDLITGGLGADTFMFTSGSGTDTLTDFALLDDTLNLSGTALSTREEVTAAASEQVINGQSGLLIALSQGDAIFLVGISAADLATLQLDF